MGLWGAVAALLKSISEDIPDIAFKFGIPRWKKNIQLKIFFFLSLFNYEM